MSLFKTSVSTGMFVDRLSQLFEHTSRSLRESVEGMNRAGIGERVYQAIRYKTDSLVAFAMQFAVKTYLRPEEGEVVLKSFALDTGVVTGGEDEYYWKRFGDIPKNRSVFATVQIEYMMVGNAFLEQCGGKTGMQEFDNLIRQFGADTFRRVCEITKKEIKSVRLYM